MKTIGLIVWGVIFAFFTREAFADSSPPYRSKYIGQEHREIKSLSKEDIDELKNGRGWGLAKAAELNGIPGPIHLLEMKEEIKLTEDQRRQIEQLYEEMKEKAISLGLKLIELERELDLSFAKRTIKDDKLQALLKAIAEVQWQLRYVHLSTHLKVPAIITPEQITLYNHLRGYASRDHHSGHQSSHGGEHGAGHAGGNHR